MCSKFSLFNPFLPKQQTFTEVKKHRWWKKWKKHMGGNKNFLKKFNGKLLEPLKVPLKVKTSFKFFCSI